MKSADALARELFVILKAVAPANPKAEGTFMHWNR
jgi:hypothetical protein